MDNKILLEQLNASFFRLMDVSRFDRKCKRDWRMRDIMILKEIYTTNDSHRMTISSLAKVMKVTNAAMSQIINGYEKKGWIERVRDENDRRSVYVQVTKETVDRLKNAWLTHQERMLDFLDYLGQEDSVHLVRILDKALDYMEETHD